MVYSGHNLTKFNVFGTLCQRDAEVLSPTIVSIFSGQMVFPWLRWQPYYRKLQQYLSRLCRTLLRHTATVQLSLNINIRSGAFFVDCELLSRHTIGYVDKLGTYPRAFKLSIPLLSFMRTYFVRLTLPIVGIVNPFSLLGIVYPIFEERSTLGNISD